MDKKLVIFDLDGTLIDTKTFIIDALNKCSIDFHYDDLNEEDIRALRNSRSVDFLRTLHISFWKAPFLIRKIQNMLSRKIESMELVDGLPETLIALKKKGCILAVITSNSQRNMELFFNKYKNTYFDTKRSNVFVFGKHRAIKRLAKENGVALKDTYYVGDETRDIEAAKSVGAKTIAVTWGFNTEHILRMMDPFCLAYEPAQIVTCVENG